MCCALCPAGFQAAARADTRFRLGLIIRIPKQANGVGNGVGPPAASNGIAMEKLREVMTTYPFGAQ